MRLKIAPKLTSKSLAKLLEEAQNAEICRDVPALQEILQPVWNDIEITPDYQKFDDPTKAELLRLSGSFLTLFASSKNSKNYHLRAKDLLTAALTIFESIHLPEKINQTNIWLGFAFANCGEIEEYKLIYKILANNLKEYPLSTNALLVIINRLKIHIHRTEYKKALPLANNNLQIFECASDSRLKAMFYVNAGIIFNENKKYQSAVDCFNNAATLLAELDIPEFEARNYNELSLLYKNLSFFIEAHKSIKRATEIATKIKNEGLIACFLDTRASIFLDQNRYSEALRQIEKAIDYFSHGDNSLGLIEAMWIRCFCLLRLDRSGEAFEVFGELRKIAREKIGESAVTRFDALFKDEFYPLRGLPVDAEKEALEEYLTRKALIKAKGKLGKATEILGLDNYQALQYNLKYKFPDLKIELDLPQRKSRSVKKKPEIIKPAQPRTAIIYRNERNEVYQEKIIAPVDLPSKIYSYKNLLNPPKNVQTFYFNDAQMEVFGKKEDAVIAVSPLSQLSVGTLAVVKVEGSFVTGKIEYSDWEDIYYILDQNGFPIPLDQDNIEGKVEGYCPFSKTDSNFIEFLKFDF